MTIANKSLRAYNAVMAFQHFAGKSLKAIDAVEELPDEAILSFERSLRAISDRLRTEDAEKWPDLHKLAAQIDHNVGRDDPDQPPRCEYCGNGADVGHARDCSKPVGR